MKRIELNLSEQSQSSAHFLPPGFQSESTLAHS